MPAKAARPWRSSLPWLLLGGGLFALTGVGFVLFSDSDKQLERQVVEKKKATAVEKPSPEVGEPLAQDLTIADDGESLWISPTTGKPIDLGYLLPGTQLILHVRVADMLAHSEGEKVLAALGPWGQQAVEALTRSTGVSISEIETLLLGIRPAQDGSLEYALHLRLMRTKTQAEIGQRTPNGRVCFLPTQTDGKDLVSCPSEALQELIATAGRPPLFARELQRVLQRTDQQRIATLVFAGKFLQISGERFLQGTGEPLRTELVDFLGDEATATALSLHWDENFFVELRSTVALNQRPHRFAALLEQRVVASSDQVEDVILAEPLHPYSRKVLARFPAMLRKLGNYTRSDQEEGLCVLRAYLPSTAGHNLVMATELLLSRGTPATVHLAEEPLAEPQTIDQRLRQTTSLVFPKETLQRALEMVSEDLGISLEIAGRDLQLEGITKNQSFGIDLRDRPGAEILLAVLMRANPDRTASGPSDVRQKLVYVLREAEGDRPGVIVVTTRTAASQRGEKLPSVFEPATR